MKNYIAPLVTLLEDYEPSLGVSDEEINENRLCIEETFGNFGISIQRIQATVGPTITLFEIEAAQGSRISRIQDCEKDIAQNLNVNSIRIIAPIPGRTTIGIEVPNRHKEIVSMRSAVQSERFHKFNGELPVVIGHTIQNENFVFDLAQMPHLLVAGATGQGKSVGLNAIIISLLYSKDPSQLKLVLIDPKMAEFSLYAKLEKHFLAKMASEDEAIVTDPKKAVYTLDSLCIEMDVRLALCRNVSARNIVEYNEKIPDSKYAMPYIVVVIDEFADLITNAKEFETLVMRLAQNAHTVGIHLVVATRHTDKRIISSGIKANFPARIAFRTAQTADSRTILDRAGAEQLVGCGDMFFSNDDELTRIQSVFIGAPEIERIVNFISEQRNAPSVYTLPDYRL